MLITRLGVSNEAQTFGSMYQHPSLNVAMPVYRRIRDCLENRVKSQRKVYLPDPSEVREDSAIREKRYEHYIARATWLPVTKRTVQGLTAQVFIKRPTLTTGVLPDDFVESPSILGDEMDGFARYALSENLSLGRGAIVGIYTDTGRWLLDFIEAENIVAWSELPYGKCDGIGRNIESVTVRTFFTQTQDDSITTEFFSVLTQYKIDSRGYCFMRSSVSSQLMSVEWGAWQVVTVKGEILNYVPVFIVGAERNILSVQTPPIEELAELNLSHYINSADYEEHAKVAGQVTPVITGLDQTWYDKNIKGAVMFGVRSPLPLPKEADAKLLQAQANSVSKEALDKKEKMMVSVGARLIEERTIRRTATEADIEDQAYYSILGHIAQNVSNAMTSALRHISRYYTADTKPDNSIIYRLNTDFSTATSSAEHRRLLLEEYIAGARSFSEYRKALQLFDQTVTLDDNEARSEIIADLPFRQQINNAITAQQPTSGDNRSDPTPTE